MSGNYPRKIVLILDDEPIHTEERPFCHDMRCPCHGGQEEYFLEYILQPLENGLMTLEEAGRIFRGEQLA